MDGHPDRMYLHQLVDGELWLNTPIIIHRRIDELRCSFSMTVPESVEWLDPTISIYLCRTMACFERDLHTLIYGGDHVVLALYRSYL